MTQVIYIQENDLVEKCYYILCIPLVLDKMFVDFFYVFEQFLFNTSETELNYYHQKVTMWVVWRVAEGFKTKDLRKLGNIKKILDILRVDSEYEACHLKSKFWQLFYKTEKDQL